MSVRGASACIQANCSNSCAWVQTKAEGSSTGTATGKAVSIKEYNESACPATFAKAGDLSAMVSHIRIGPAQLCPFQGEDPCMGPKCILATSAEDAKAPVKVTTVSNPRRGVFELVIRRLNGAPLARNELMLEWTPPPTRSPPCGNPCAAPCIHPGSCRPSKCKMIVCRPSSCKPRCCKRACKKPCYPPSCRSPCRPPSCRSPCRPPSCRSRCRSPCRPPSCRSPCRSPCRPKCSTTCRVSRARRSSPYRPACRPTPCTGACRQFCNNSCPKPCKPSSSCLPCKPCSPCKPRSPCKPYKTCKPSPACKPCSPCSKPCTPSSCVSPCPTSGTCGGPCYLSECCSSNPCSSVCSSPCLRPCRKKPRCCRAQSQPRIKAHKKRISQCLNRSPACAVVRCQSVPSSCVSCCPPTSCPPRKCCSVFPYKPACCRSACSTCCA